MRTAGRHALPELAGEQLVNVRHEGHAVLKLDGRVQEVHAGQEVRGDRGVSAALQVRERRPYVAAGPRRRQHMHGSCTARQNGHEGVVVGSHRSEDLVSGQHRLVCCLRLQQSTSTHATATTSQAPYSPAHRAQTYREKVVHVQSNGHRPLRRH